MQKVWKVADNINASNNSVLERLLQIRGITSEKKKADFLEPLKMQFTSPYAFCDMQKCVDRIFEAIENKEKIVVWGDFDADGVTSTCLMYKTLQYLGANVEYYIPSRQNESHGLNSQAIVKFLTKKIKLFITVDCASTNAKEIALIKSFGSDIIVTDHHETDVEIPEMFGLINPKAQNNLDEKLSIEEIEYLTNLAGVGVAFKLALALLEKVDKKDFVNELLPLVALGTIADIVPLIGENRAFVKLGLELIKKGVNKGVSALLKSINYNYEINSNCIAFYVAPRINASGRLDSAQVAFDLLYETDDEKLDKCCATLNQYNLERQELCDTTFEDALNLIRNNKDFDKEPAIVLYKADWNIGIIGIVASQLVETFYKPTFLMCDKDDLISCSSRGIEETDIHSIISNISDFLENGGGHKMAGGFAFNPQKNSFDLIKQQINETVSEMLDDIELKPHINIDLELNSNEINLDLVDELKKLEPFGTANSVPVFCLKDSKIVDARLMGQNKNHLKLKCQKDDNIYDCVFWNKDFIPKAKDDLINIAFIIQKNEFNGNVNVQLDLKDIQYENLESAQKIRFIDQRQKENICEILEDYCFKNADKIKIYAYKNETLKELEKYPNLSKNILTKALTAQQLVFMDYPKTLDNFKIILDKIQPQVVHLPKNNIKMFDADDYFKTFLGLLKYVQNKKAGQINIKDISNYFTYDENLINETLNFFKDMKIIEISNDKLAKLSSIELSKLKTNAQFKEIEKQLQTNNAFLNKLCSANISEIEELVLN